MISLCVCFRRRLRIKISEFQSFSLLPVIPLFFPALYRVEFDRRRRVPFKLLGRAVQTPKLCILWFLLRFVTVSIASSWVLSLGNPSQPGSLIFPDSAQESLLPRSQHASVGMACNVNQLISWQVDIITVNDRIDRSFSRDSLMTGP